MTGGEFKRTEEIINNGKAISKTTYYDLVAYKDQIVKHIDKCARKGDVAQAMWFRNNELLKLLDLIDKAKVICDEAS